MLFVVTGHNSTALAEKAYCVDAEKTGNRQQSVCPKDPIGLNIPTACIYGLVPIPIPQTIIVAPVT